MNKTFTLICGIAVLVQIGMLSLSIHRHIEYKKTEHDLEELDELFFKKCIYDIWDQDVIKRSTVARDSFDCAQKYLLD